MNSNLTILRARLVFPVAGPPIDGGRIAIEKGTIRAVGADLDSAGERDLGNVAILPGLVNAHTHLEFSTLAEPLGRPGMSLPDWLRMVIGWRRGAESNVELAVARGLTESVGAGTAVVGEIATADWRGSANLPAEIPTTVLFHESIGPTLPRAEQSTAAAGAFLAAPAARSDLLAAISPHAPYTVHPRLLAGLVELSRRHDVPLAMHLAESREELELLEAGDGPFRELLAAADGWDPAAEARLGSVLAYLRELARAPRSLVIHGNYLSADESEFLAAHRDTMSVVYCPRTHAFFAHEPYPLTRLLDSGVRVALGTDSRASNPDLSVLAEVRHVAAQHPDVAPATVLQLGTQSGAAALGLSDRFGTIEPGKAANFAIVALGDDSHADPHELLFAPEARVVQTWIQGRATG